MKIGLVRRGYSPTGGAEAYLQRLASELLLLGHKVAVFSDVLWPSPALLQGGTSVELPPDQAVPDPDYTMHVLGYMLKGFAKEPRPARMSPARFANEIREDIREARCDFLLSLERIRECDAYRAGDGVHAVWLEKRARFEPAWRGFFRRFNPKHRQILCLESALLTGAARGVIANSQMVKNEIIARFGTPADRIQVIYNGVPPWRDEPGLRERKRAELGLGERDYGVLFAGSGWERKGLRFAMEAMNAVPGTLLVAGRGKARGLPASGRVRFLGPQDAGQMRALLAAADAFVLPTIYDPFSNACLEALAAGLPVITTKANGFAEIIEPGVDGEIVSEPDDLAGLRTALTAWGDAGKRLATRERRLSKGAGFSIERNVAETLKFIEQQRPSPSHPA